VVQQTLLEAYESIDRFRGDGHEAEVAWLRRILARNLADAGREHRRGKRDVARELSLEAHLGRSSMHLERLLAGSEVRPSAGLHAEERALRVARAMRTLTEEEYEVLILKHWQGKPYTEIAEIIGKDRFAVARCERRALIKLKRELGER
jgi:RNA polymerase sigma-70 factor (ECF subfamily)